MKKKWLFSGMLACLLTFGLVLSGCGGSSRSSGSSDSPVLDTVAPPYEEEAVDIRTEIDTFLTDYETLMAELVKLTGEGDYDAVSAKYDQLMDFIYKASELEQNSAWTDADARRAEILHEQVAGLPQ
jgi:hypothetical protein